MSEPNRVEEIMRLVEELYCNNTSGNFKIVESAIRTIIDERDKEILLRAEAAKEVVKLMMERDALRLRVERLEKAVEGK